MYSKRWHDYTKKLIKERYYWQRPGVAFFYYATMSARTLTDRRIDCNSWTKRLSHRAKAPYKWQAFYYARKVVNNDVRPNRIRESHLYRNGKPKESGRVVTSFSPQMQPVSICRMDP